MHSAAYRANALLTYAGSALALLACLAALSDLFHAEAPVLDARVARVERLAAAESGSDEALLAFALAADFTSSFSWNTKLLFVWLAAEYSTPVNGLNQVVLWDRIVEAREDAAFTLPFVRTKYKLADQGHHLRGLSGNLTLCWNVMPLVGRLRTGRRAFPLRLPAEYTAPRQPGWQ